MNESEKMTAERSLEIITNAIEQSRKDVMRSSGTTLTLCGALVCATSAIVGTLWHITNNPEWNAIWIVAFVIGLATYLWKKKRKDIRENPTTFVSRVVGYIWQSFVAFCLITILASLSAAKTNYAMHTLPITAIIILGMAFATTLTGLVLKSRAITMCASISYVNVLMALELCGATEMVAVFIASFTMLVVPGLIIIYQTKGKKFNLE